MSNKRRNLLKWAAPMIISVNLPAHAQTSEVWIPLPTTEEPKITTTPEPTTTQAES